jgi:hypothetical protein
MNNIIQKATKFYHLIKSTLWNKDINRKCKTTIHMAYFKKMLLYGVKTWTCTKREERKIQAADMKFLEAIMGKTKGVSEMHTSAKSSGWRIYRTKLRETE